MKRVLFLLLASVLVVIGCSNDSNDNQEEKDNKVEITKEKTTEEKDDSQEGVKDLEEDNEGEQVEISDEVRSFVDDFNDLAGSSDGVNEIDDTSIEDRGIAKVLYTSQEYEILAIYHALDGYSYIDVRIAQDQPYKNLRGEGFEALLLVGRALNNDTDKLIEHFEKAFEKGEVSYFENEKPVIIDNIEGTEAGEDTWGIEVHFK